MASPAALTLRLDPAISSRLTRLAKSTERTSSSLAAEAIARYLEDNAWQFGEGGRTSEAGKVIHHAEVVKWVKSWGTKPRELKRRRY